MVDQSNPDCAPSDVLGWGSLGALSDPTTDGLVQRRSSHVVNGASSALQSPAAMSCEGDLTKIAVYSPAAGWHGLHIPRQRMRLRLTRGKEPWKGSLRGMACQQRSEILRVPASPRSSFLEPALVAKRGLTVAHIHCHGSPFPGAPHSPGLLAFLASSLDPWYAC